MDSFYPQPNHFPETIRGRSLHHPGGLGYRRRDVIQDVLDDLEDTAGDVQSNSKVLAQQATIASTLCNSDITQSLGPDWSGTFASNSQDGIYPSQTRSCRWTIQAISDSTGSSGNSRSTSYVIALNFTTSIQLVCGTDYLTLYDGPDTTTPVLAKICGNMWFPATPTFYSTGPRLTVVFTSQERSPGSYGFNATWSSVAPCSICVPAERGSCSSTNTCNCYSRYRGVVCEADTSGSKDLFTPRSQHAMAYDPVKDMVYIMGGTSLDSPFIWDMLTYSFGKLAILRTFGGSKLPQHERTVSHKTTAFSTVDIATNKWDKITLDTKGPDPRYGHYAFMYGEALYVYGGVSVVGGLPEVWKYSGKRWTQQQPINPEKLPPGLRGSACVVVINNNSSKLYVFGGLNAAGVTTRDLHVYDLNQAIWKKSDHQNSVGLSGATAVYHQATDSIYYFGGMVNHITRNVITYQYRISQDLWYALAPRVDPLTTAPVPYYDGTQPAFNTTEEDMDDDSDTRDEGNTTQYLQPVVYDSVSTVWAPAALLGDDSVVMFGGMRPYGPGVNDKEHSCFSKRFTVYDLCKCDLELIACQKWTTFDVSELEAALGGRVNHTMILRPPGAAGGSKTAWTGFIFGGFDGTDRADVLNITLNIVTPTPSTVNNCRALRWCSLYDDCQYCNPSYCSYVNGLCLFDTEKAKNSPYLVGSSVDVPRTGTVQDLVRQRPELKSQVLKTDGCPARIALSLGNPYSNTIQEGQELTFKIYINAHDLDIQFEIRTLPTSGLDFKSLNVWEGFMNMYWRADHGLSDESWDGHSRISSPIPPDALANADNMTLDDNAVITSAGTLNTSELMDRWTKYAGLDTSPSSSAMRANSSYIYFPAADPRRFSGYYVFSMTNRSPTTLSFSVTVTLLDHPTLVDNVPGSKFNMATLGFFMLGFIIAMVLLIFLARKIRQLIEDRDASHRAAEMQFLEDEEEERSRRNGMIQVDGTAMKPMYKVVVGVQDMNKQDMAGFTLRHRIRHGGRDSVAGVGKYAEDSVNGYSVRFPAETPVLYTTHHEQGQEQQQQQRVIPEARQSRVRSDFIRDIGSAPLPLTVPRDSVMTEADSSLVRRYRSTGGFFRTSASSPDLGRYLDSDVLMKKANAGTGQEVLSKQTEPLLGTRGSSCATKADAIEGAITLQQSPDQRNSGGGCGVQRGWSLKSLSRVTSFKRQQKSASCSSEEKAALTCGEVKEKDEDEQCSLASSGIYDSEQELKDLGILSAHTDLLQIRQERLEKHQRELEEGATTVRRRRNPNRVQPISIEPLPFHAGLVPRILPNLKRYRRYLAGRRRQRQQLNESPYDQSLSVSAGVGISAAAPQGKRQSNTGQRLSHRSSSRLSSMNYPTTPMSASASQVVRATRSQGSLREVHRVASRITLRTTTKPHFGDSDIVGSKSLAERRSSQDQSQHSSWFREDDTGSDLNEDPGAEIELQQFVASRPNKDDKKDPEGSIPPESMQTTLQDQQPSTEATTMTAKSKPIKMRGRQQYEPGPLIAMNYLIVFPGDDGSRRVHQQGDMWRSRPQSDNMPGETGAEGQSKVKTEFDNDNTLYNMDMKLPPMAIGTVFVPDPVRWWAYKAKQVQDRLKFKRQMRRLHQLKEKEKEKEQQQQQARSRTRTRILNL
ncbi:Multiple epidermal growth factor-like domains protein 8 [Modicella reniformis]|uniref:Multiple epidermal growth factor-like domains protein 8 n=1 Tax=Modicella reniformis TaxID=1440133 RepID=A0A9P6MAQ4_9FUNG|nr:Multiple epidermal growth factor-like domains protein 8 [Modicella reniformis]